MIQIDTVGIPVSSDLLRVGTISLTTKSKVPLMMEFPVNEETGPFLVSSARHLLWVRSHNKMVKAAFRPMSLHAFFAEVVQEVFVQGFASEWGNVHSLTPEGVQAAIAHLLYYDLASPEILAHPNCALHLPDTHLGCKVHRADWLDTETIVVVPQDRDYLGFVATDDFRGISVVHNSSRALAVCRNLP